MPNAKVQFANDAGEPLAGVLDMPSVAPRAYALFAHCFTCGKDLKAAARISSALTSAGIAVLRFDFTGLGRSGGDFAATTFSSNVGDLLAAARFLSDSYAPPAILVGHSLGGTAVLQAAAQMDSAVAVATIGAPADPQHVLRLLGDSADDLEAKGAAQVVLAGRPFTIRRDFVKDLRRHNLPEAIGSLRKALLVMHAPLDETVELDNASRLFAAAKHPKSFISLDRADHLLSNSDDSVYAGQVLAAWASRYLPAGAAEPAVDIPEGQVVARTHRDGFLTELEAGQHRLLADEPAAVGGSNLGPTPYGLLSAALAACTSMTLRMYANHKQLSVDTITVRVAHDRIHAEDCSDCEATAGRVDVFEREVAFAGDLSDAQRERLLEIADKCPVHKTLQGEIRIRTRLG